MTENITQMRKRHAKEIKELQDNCSHKKISNWMDYMWAPGHFSGRVKICMRCDKIIERETIQMPNFETICTPSDEETEIFIDGQLNE